MATPNLIPRSSAELEPLEMAHLSCLLAKLLAKSNHSPEQSEAAAEAGMQLIHRLTERLERDDTVVSRANLSWAGSTLSQPASQAHGVGIGCSSNPSNSRKPTNTQGKCSSGRVHDNTLRSFLKSLKVLKTGYKPPRFVIGVVGQSGAGKSLLLNALLEAKLLPTSDRGACTAAPIEISYNNSEEPSALFRAEVEFITREEWVQAAEDLFAELLDENGEVSDDCTKAGTVGGVAFAKLKAVYPNKTMEMLASGDADDFADEPTVSAVLGTVRPFEGRSAADLRRDLQQYVASRGPTVGDSAPEFWPLVKVVRIYTKAAALSTGAVIVDLPGSYDNNEARAAVAAEYKRTCDGLWIVAPILRAATDKIAMNLMGDSFRRQLMFDGTYSKVTFICSKTDDLDFDAATRHPGIGQTISELNQVEDLKKSKARLNLQLSELESAEAKCMKEFEKCESENDVWEDLEGQFRDSMTDLVLSQSAKKETRANYPSRRNPASLDTGDGVEITETDEGPLLFQDREPLNSLALSSALLLLKSPRRHLHEFQQLRPQMAKIRLEMGKVQSELERLLGKSKADCIKRRNDDSREVIKQQFAMGIKELDQDGAAFDPFKDYDQVAQNLPVFCVSGSAFQKLTGIGSQYFDSRGYMTARDTEIPQLQEHAKKLTEAGRIRTCQQFLNRFIQLSNSINLWASSAHRMHNLPMSDQMEERRQLKQLLEKLQRRFQRVVAGSVESIRQCLEESLYNSFSQASLLAADGAVDTAKGWGASPLDGGLYWSTYRATVLHRGVYKGSAGERNFNDELYQPISRHLAPGWELAFQRRIPAILSESTVELRKLLDGFYGAAFRRFHGCLPSIAGSVLLARNIDTHRRTLETLSDQIAATIEQRQKEARLEFTKVIRKAMTGAYKACAAKRGTGSFSRMKAAMVHHVEAARSTMFHEATKMVKEHLLAMCDVVETELSSKADEICKKLYIDCILEFGDEAEKEGGLDECDLQLRADIRDLLRHADDAFAFPDVGSTDGGPEVAPVESIQGPTPESDRDSLTGHAIAA